MRKQFTREESLAMLQELAGVTCQCGRPKRHAQTFCRVCFDMLSERMQRALYHGWNSGYQEAYAAALATLRRVQGAGA